MAATNIFYRVPTQRGTRVVSIAGTECTLDQFCKHILDTEGLDRRDFIIANGTKIFRPNSCNLQSINLQNNSNVDILIPSSGGKGGFGSLLRAIGAQIEKTTNRDACRDLSGRRLRDIKREEELKKLIELRAALEKERKRRKKEKFEKLKQNSDRSKTSASIQELVAIFDDHAFNRRRLELGDIIDAAVEKGLINSKRQANGSVDKTMDGAIPYSTKMPTTNEETDLNSRSFGDKKSHDGTIEDRTQNNLIESKVITSLKVSKRNKKDKDLWLGLDMDDIDEDNEEGEHRACSSNKVS